MKKSFLSLIPLAGAILISCSSGRYEESNIREAFFDWGVANNTTLFEEYDSLYYIINPIGNVFDSLYYNGNYTDSYYRQDSTRVTFAYTSQDSIKFYIDRMYAVQTNPPHLLLTAFIPGDTAVSKCTLLLDKAPNNDNLFLAGPDSAFTHLLQQEQIIKFAATNASSASEPQGSQNYEFTLNTIGYMQAINQASSLNPSLPPPLAVKSDSIH